MEDSASYVDGTGTARALPAGDGRSGVEIRLGGRQVGAIEYDSTLIADPEPVQAAAAVVAIALERDRLTAELTAASMALRESRSRVVKAADQERRRIARDLHDGVQVRLTLLTVHVDLARRDAAAVPSARSIDRRHRRRAASDDR